MQGDAEDDLIGIDFLALSREQYPALSIQKEEIATGGSNDSYRVVINGIIGNGIEYAAECTHIIEALGMTFAEGNVFKAVWRIAAARQGRSKPGYKQGKYDAEKIVFFGNRMIKHAETGASK